MHKLETERVPAMGLYAWLENFSWTRGHWPRKLGVLLFLATHASLLFYVLAKWLLSSPIDLPLVLMVFGFDLGAWIVAYIFMRDLFAPLNLAAAALRAHLEKRGPVELPEHYTDVAGQLLRDARYLTQHATGDQDAADIDRLTGFYTQRAGKRRLLEDTARADRGQMKFHFVFISLHGIADVAAVHGNARIDALLVHVATLLQMNIRKTDWIVRWSDHLFALGFCNNTQAQETVQRLHGVVESSPFDIAPGVSLAPVVACGVAVYATGLTAKGVYDLAREAIKTAEGQLEAPSSSKRIVILTPPTQVGDEFDGF